MDNDQPLKNQYNFNSKMLLLLSLVSFILSMFIPFDLNDSYKVNTGRVIAAALGSTFALIIFPLIFVWLISVFFKIFKTKLESHEFWKGYLIVWVIFAFLSLSGRIFFK